MCAYDYIKFSYCNIMDINTEEAFDALIHISLLYHL